MFSELIVTPVNTKSRNDWLCFKLVEDFRFTNHSHDIVVPKGFITDFASVPRLAWYVIPPLGSYSRSSIIHDFLCVSPGISRKYANEIMMECMEAEGVSKWQRKTIYAAIEAYRILKRIP